MAIQDEFTKFGIYVAIIGFALFVLGFIFVTSLNFTAENQVHIQTPQMTRQNLHK